MLFQSLQFVLFFVPVFVLNFFYARNPDRLRYRKVLLVAASAVFYMSWNIPLFSLLLVSILLNYLVGRFIHESSTRKKKWIAFGIASQLALLAFFKYATLGLESLDLAVSALGIQPLNIRLDILLPLGISFYTFHGMSYIIDVYRGKYRPYDSFLDFFLYISFFPQLIAGPIVRADYFLDRLRGIGHPISLPMVSSGLFLFVSGAFKKTVLADNAAKIANLTFLEPAGLSSLVVLLGVYAFAFQIYFDFSGYTDMARGLGRMLGIDLPINFNLPYLSRGLREFWQKWHISLSTWLRDYLYISLGGSRGSDLITYRNLLITMLLGGLWHGASYTFLWWGAIHGIALAAEHALFGKTARTIRSPLANIVVIFLTFNLVCLAWIFFRADSLAAASEILLRLTDLRGYLAFEELKLFKPQNWAFGLLLPAAFTFILERRASTNDVGLEMSTPFRRAAAFSAMLLLILLIAGKTNEFIYFQF